MKVKLAGPRTLKAINWSAIAKFLVNAGLYGKKIWDNLSPEEQQAIINAVKSLFGM